MHENLSKALDEISDQYIAEAASPRKHRRPYWIGTLAAALTLAILVGIITNSMSLNVNAIATAQYPDTSATPQIRNYVANDTSVLDDFFAACSSQILSGTKDNISYSPMNIYMALAMLAEVTDGNSRTQILELLGYSDIDALRPQARSLWQETYLDSEHSTRILANSLWLDDSISYKQEPLDTLAENYYASSFEGDLGSKDANKALHKWLNDQTGNLLKDTADEISLSPNSILALASAVYFHAKWVNQFSPEFNTTDTFHGARGDTDCTFMHLNQHTSTYYSGNGFGAICLPLEGNNSMWLVLPDEGISTDTLLQDSRLTDLFTGKFNMDDTQWVRVNLSLPKFDVASQMDLVSSLQELGITDVFDPAVSDFTNVLEGKAHLSQVSHATRVTVDEDGVTAAAYTVMDADSACAPPKKLIEFNLNRPFLFAITAEGNLPLFTGIVNNP